MIDWVLLIPVPFENISFIFEGHYFKGLIDLSLKSVSIIKSLELPTFLRFKTTSCIKHGLQDNEAVLDF